MPYPTSNHGSTKPLIEGLSGLARHLEGLGMLEEASYARSIAIDLQAHVILEDHSFPVLVSARRVSEQSDLQKLAYRVYKYLIVLHLQAQDHRLMKASIEPNPPPHEKTIIGTTDNRCEPGEALNVCEDISLPVETCTACDAFFCRPSSPTIPPSNSASDPSSAAPLTTPNRSFMWYRHFCTAMGIDHQRKWKLIRANVDFGDTMLRTCSVPRTPDKREVIKMVQRAIGQNPWQRATAKEICVRVWNEDQLFPWAGESEAMQLSR